MSKMIDDGGPAFPGQPCGSDGLPQQQAFNGMSLRDFFAGKALTGLISSHYRYSDKIEGMARDAYCIADAMLAERRKKE